MTLNTPAQTHGHQEKGQDTKLTWLANLVGLERTASEEAITERLVSNMRLANAVKMRANEEGRLDPAIREMVNAIAGEAPATGIYPAGRTNQYSPLKIGRDGSTDPSLSGSGPYTIREVRPGLWQLYELQPDGTWKPYKGESMSLDRLKSDMETLNRKARNKANESLANEIRERVNNEMIATACTYDQAWLAVKKKHPVLFAAMHDPAPAQRRQMPKRG